MGMDRTDWLDIPKPSHAVCFDVIGAKLTKPGLVHPVKSPVCCHVARYRQKHYAHDPTPAEAGEITGGL